MRTTLINLLVVALLMAACQSSKTEAPKGKAPYAFKDPIATGKDSGMVNLTGIRRTNVKDAICQHWELADMEGAEDIDWVLDKKGKRIFPELVLFNDSSYLENPRSHFAIGTWRIEPTVDKLMLVLRARDKTEKAYTIVNINSRGLHLGGFNSNGDPMVLKLSSDGLVHKNKNNDPFHPINNQWRVKPAKPESDSAIAARTKACVKFYLLYYRDNLKRHKDKISFIGLPAIMEWYRRGIGLPDKEDISDSWVACFYNKEQALKGYDVLRKLIVDYEFKWPDNAPDWRLETMDVLGQMYRKM